MNNPSTFLDCTSLIASSILLRTRYSMKKYQIINTTAILPTVVHLRVWAERPNVPVGLLRSTDVQGFS